MTTSILENPELMNEVLFDQLLSDDPAQVKTAADSIDAYTRVYVRESMVMEQVLPLKDYAPSEFDKRLEDSRLHKVFEKEPKSGPGAIIPFLTSPRDNQLITGQRYSVVLFRTSTPRYSQDIDLLRSYDYDIRQVISDNSIKDLDTVYDRKFFGMADTIVGAKGTANTAGNANSQHVGLSNITRSSLAEMLKAPLRTPSRAKASTVVINAVTAQDIIALGPDEVGEELAAATFSNGVESFNFLQVKWVVTIKDDIVLDGVFYMFVPPKMLGRHIAPTDRDTVMVTKVEGPNIHFNAYGLRGATIGNIWGVTKASFG